MWKPGAPTSLSLDISWLLLKIQMEKNARKVRNQDINPCIEETSASQKCLDAYNYDKSMCSAYFQRYRDCRKYWHNIMLQRRRDGVSPDMPTAAERQEMLAAIGGKPYWRVMKVTQRHCEDQRTCSTGEHILVMLLHCTSWVYTVMQGLTCCQALVTWKRLPVAYLCSEIQWKERRGTQGKTWDWLLFEFW